MRYLILTFLLIWNLQTYSTNYIVERKSEPVMVQCYPKLNYADSVINNSPVNNNSVAWRCKNPGNLRSFSTGKYREFESLELGYDALIHQLSLYTSGKSMWTDSTTTLEEYVNIYASEARSKENYIRVLENGLSVSRASKISLLDVDSLAKYHIKMEDCKLFKIMY